MVIFYLDQNNFLDLSQDSDRYAINWLLRSESSTSTSTERQLLVFVFAWRFKMVVDYLETPCKKTSSMDDRTFHCTL